MIRNVYTDLVVSGNLEVSGTIDGIQLQYSSQDTDERYAASGHTIESHTNFITTTPIASGHHIGFDGTNWVNTTPGTGGGGGATTLDALTDTTLGTLTSGEVLSYNGTAWVNAFTNPSGFQVPSGNYVTVAHGNELWQASGNYAISGNYATVEQGNELWAQSGFLNPSGFQVPSGNYATVEQGHELWQASGNYAISGNYVTVTHGNELWAQSGFLNPSGFQVPSGNYATYEAGNIDWAASGHQIDSHSDYAGVASSGHLLGFDGTNWRPTTSPTGGAELPDYSGVIGQAEDSDYTDGLFTDFVSGTLIGTAIDRINEVLSSLAPSPAPALDDVDIDTNGNNAELSFGATNSEPGYTNVAGIGSLSSVDVDGSFNDSGDRAGVINATTDATGTLNEDVAEGDGSPTAAYPANAFGNADQGELILELNGTEVRVIDLTNAAAVDDGSSATGFNISAATSVNFPNGDPFDVFKYRTGSWRVDSGATGVSGMVNGWNYVRVIHRITGSPDVTTNYCDWVVDDSTFDTEYTGAVLDNLNMTGSSYLAGVRYHTGGDADYDITVSGAQVFTYQAGSAVTFNETNGSIPNQSLSAIGGGGSPQQDNTYTNLTFTIDSTDNRILGGSIATTVSTARTFNSNEGNDPGGSASISGILLDTFIDDGDSTDSTEDFRDEDYRLKSNLDIDNTSYSSGPGNGPADYTWDSTSGLITGGTGHSDGLLLYNNGLHYPNSVNVLNAGDFRNTGDGGLIANGYASNPNYQGATGDRVYLRYYYDAANTQNFTLTVDGSSTSFVAVSTGPSGNNLTLEMLAPATTSDGSVTVWKDCFTAYTTDNAVGCYTTGTRSASTSNWGITLGTKSTATSANVIVLRITASSSWTGNIDDLDVSFD